MVVSFRSPDMLDYAKAVMGAEFFEIEPYQLIETFGVFTPDQQCVSRQVPVIPLWSIFDLGERRSNNPKLYRLYQALD